MGGRDFHPFWQFSPVTGRFHNVYENLGEPNKMLLVHYTRSRTLEKITTQLRSFTLIVIHPRFRNAYGEILTYCI